MIPGTRYGFDNTSSIFRIGFTQFGCTARNACAAISRSYLMPRVTTQHQAGRRKTPAFPPPGLLLADSSPLVIVRTGIDCRKVSMSAAMPHTLPAAANDEDFRHVNPAWTPAIGVAMGDA
jgi:hypothetical protein